MNKQRLSESDVRAKFITPALVRAGWNETTQIRREVYFTDGRIYVKGTLTARGKKKFADYILYYKPNIPLAIVEAKDSKHSHRAGIQQVLEYAHILDIPFVFSSNGEGFLFHDKTKTSGNVEIELSNNDFPSPQELWAKYKQYKGIETPEVEKVVEQDYYFDRSGRSPRYYQQNAINRTVEAIAKGQNRVLLVMATGTGKTYTAFQIIHRLWKSGAKKRILFLADRNALINQTRRGDFKHFKKDTITVVRNRMIDKSYQIYLALYQGLSGADEHANAYKQFSPEFFDLIVIDECHRGSANDNSAWREILKYFKKATHIGLTATPKETNEASNSEYFGDPIYTYSLKQGIDDGFLAPYRVIRITLDVDAQGWRPEQGKTDKQGKVVEDRVYNRRDYDRNLVIDERTQTVANKLTEFMKGFDRFAKTIVFCSDIDHAERMRAALVNANSDLVAKNHTYIMQITGDNEEGKRELDNFINPEERYPVIATTSELMTTGVDAQTCKIIVLDSEIQSMTKFKQIIGRGTRINEDFDKMYFTILDFRNVTDLFADKQFDGDPIRVKPVSEQTDLTSIIEEEENDDTPVVDEWGDEISMTSTVYYPDPDDMVSGDDFVCEPTPKFYVNGVDVSVLQSREVYFDTNGKPITTSLKAYTKSLITEQYASLHDFLNKWNSTDRKEAIIQELENQGVLVNALQNAVGRDIDLFDVICHVAFDQPPLTRRERANNVKKRNYFTKYGDKARKVLESLLDKYADEGIANIESMDILQVKSLTNYGSPLQIIQQFGSKAKYLEAVKELEYELYKTGA